MSENYNQYRNIIRVDLWQGVCQPSQKSQQAEKWIRYREHIHYESPDQDEWYVQFKYEKDEKEWLRLFGGNDLGDNDPRCINDE